MRVFKTSQPSLARRWEAKLEVPKLVTTMLVLSVAFCDTNAIKALALAGSKLQQDTLVTGVQLPRYPRCEVSRWPAAIAQVILSDLIDFASPRVPPDNAACSVHETAVDLACLAHNSRSMRGLHYS